MTNGGGSLRRSKPPAFPRRRYYARNIFDCNGKRRRPSRANIRPVVQYVLEFAFRSRDCRRYLKASRVDNAQYILRPSETPNVFFYS